MEVQSIDIKLIKNIRECLLQCLCLAGRKSLSWHPLVSDFLIIAKKLEKLGFIYHRGGVLIIEPEDAYGL
jgi:hypothetical protein